jgi:hypothetical protein
VTGVNPATAVAAAIEAWLPGASWFGVPDFRLAAILQHVRGRVTVAPREDLAVAAAFGAALFGSPTIIYMKDAGLGHSVDSILTTFVEAKVPYTLIIGTAPTNGLVPDHHEVWRSRISGLLGVIGANTFDIPRVSEVPWDIPGRAVLSDGVALMARGAIGMLIP